MIAHRKVAGCTYSERAQSKNVLRLPVQYAGKDRRRWTPGRLLFVWLMCTGAATVGLAVLIHLFAK